ncbi:hypothetical protein GobsT_26420 [Gemmata obscuriglobus]|uniref:Signal transduction histidine kinase subgroup 3 dimerisation and phosphoacceptor domain-containing protein n=1 Tax=Gemmata obscuriglobus TaxID=114 RepID=A0A2Z3H695_9BACT|nr:hypothetical protein [Gemmata obscuriglobus]AWM39086.1 hypothetical protein C1280_20255 [Gemmata obscuriglobus]QEG27878.1 hypothetical protein GobsT_26420 [Gemmata obscuriglobus]VTS05282.1 Uncharacterized protein OS=Photobacterium profundum GN=PBPRB1928 PE=4 SV=1 [Gemmata obscuriglobus UQM 2246]
MRSLQWFPCTITAALVTAAGAVTVAATGVDIVHVEFFARDTSPVHKWDELVLALGLLVTGFAVDRAAAVLRLRRAAERDRLEAARQAERVDVLRATMRTVQDIVNNFLAGVQWVAIEGEGVLAPETLKLLNASIWDTTAKIKALGDLERVDEEAMAIGNGVSIDPSGAAPAVSRECEFRS